MLLFTGPRRWPADHGPYTSPDAEAASLWTPVEGSNVLKTYEATYEDGRLRWSRESPHIKDGTRVAVVVEAESAPDGRREIVHNAVAAAKGAWGTGKPLDEIDREIAEVRRINWSGNGMVG